MRSAYIPHDRVQLVCLDQSRTKQAFGEETNINAIMAKFEKTGLIDHLNTHQGDYGDFANYADFHTSMNLIRAAGEMFMTLPPGIRSRFGNEPGQFVSFAQDPDNLAELRKMGLANPEVPNASPDDAIIPPVAKEPEEPPKAPEPPETGS